MSLRTGWELLNDGQTTNTVFGRMLEYKENSSHFADDREDYWQEAEVNLWKVVNCYFPELDELKQERKF